MLYQIYPELVIMKVLYDRDADLGIINKEEDRHSAMAAGHAHAQTCATTASLK